MKPYHICLKTGKKEYFITKKKKKTLNSKLLFRLFSRWQGGSDIDPQRRFPKLGAVYLLNIKTKRRAIINVIFMRICRILKVSILCFEVFPSKGISCFLITASCGMKNTSACVPASCTDHKQCCGCCWICLDVLERDVLIISLNSLTAPRGALNSLII